MNETSKTMRRRDLEHAAGIFPWRELYHGKILDVGCGEDKLQVAGAEVTGFDKPDGDAGKLSDHFAPDYFDAIHASHVLEHVRDPHGAIFDWLRVVKPGGYIIVTVPDIGAYEKFQYPSRFNPDHKSSWSMIYRRSCFPIHAHIPTFLKDYDAAAETRLARYVEYNYNWQTGAGVDQTFDPNAGVEIWNEFVLRRR